MVIPGRKSTVVNEDRVIIFRFYVTAFEKGGINCFFVWIIQDILVIVKPLFSSKAASYNFVSGLYFIWFTRRTLPI